MKTTVNAIDIASFFIKKGVTPLKLQKLLYYSQVWFFVKNKDYLFPEKIKAWIYGPAVHEVWDSFRYMKMGDVIPINRANDILLSKSIENHLTDIWSSYGHLSGSQLVDLTHDELPWKNSRKGLLENQPSSNDVIINSHTLIDFKLNEINKIPFVDNVSDFGRFSNV